MQRLTLYRYIIVLSFLFGSAVSLDLAKPFLLRELINVHSGQTLAHASIDYGSEYFVVAFEASTTVMAASFTFDDIQSGTKVVPKRLNIQESGYNPKVGYDNGQFFALVTEQKDQSISIVLNTIIPPIKDLISGLTLFDDLSIENTVSIIYSQNRMQSYAASQPFSRRDPKVTIKRIPEPAIPIVEELSTYWDMSAGSDECNDCIVIVYAKQADISWININPGGVSHARHHANLTNFNTEDVKCTLNDMTKSTGVAALNSEGNLKALLLKASAIERENTLICESEILHPSNENITGIENVHIESYEDKFVVITSRELQKAKHKLAISIVDSDCSVRTTDLNIDQYLPKNPTILVVDQDFFITYESDDEVFFYIIPIPAEPSTTPPSTVSQPSSPIPTFVIPTEPQLQPVVTIVTVEFEYDGLLISSSDIGAELIEEIAIRLNIGPDSFEIRELVRQQSMKRMIAFNATIGVINGTGAEGTAIKFCCLPTDVLAQNDGNLTITNVICEQSYSVQCGNSQATSTGDESPITLIVIIVVVVVMVSLLLILIVILVLFKKRRESSHISTASKSHQEEAIIDEPKTYDSVPAPQQRKDSHYAQMNDNSIPLMNISTNKEAITNSWLINPDEIEVGEKIGQGAYGVVSKGLFRFNEVALKFCTDISGADQFKEEVKLMANLRPHSNVVQVYGLYVKEDTNVLVMEFMSGGSLDAMLYGPKEGRPSLSQKKKIIIGVAKGLLHLHKEGIVHRDLAARNVLLDDRFVPKISDFGMSRNVDDAEHVAAKTKSNIGPIKWMAPENMHKSFSAKSDVWSFACLLYEIFHEKEPWYDNDNLIDIAIKIREEGTTPEIDTELTPPDYVKIMNLCWSFDPDKRPKMDHICKMLGKI